MKKIYLLLTAVSVSMVMYSCKKDKPVDPNDGNNTEISVPEVSTSIMVDFTATWCGPCGGSGTPLFKKVATDEGSKVIALGMHTNNSELVPYWLRNDTAFIKPIFAQLFNSSNIALNQQGGYGIPAFSINNVEIPRSESAFKSAIASRFSQAPDANVGFLVKATATGFTVDTKTKFFKESNGEYYIAIFVIEDKIIHRQNVNTGYVDNFEHMHIVRDVVGGPNEAKLVFGNSSIASGTQAVGSSVNNSFTYVAPTTPLPARYAAINQYNWNPANTKIAVTLWKKDGEKYVFVNGGESDYISK